MISLLQDKKYMEREAAEMIGLSVRSMQRRRLEGRPPRFLKIGTKAVRYTESDLLSFLEDARRNGGGGA